uniref:Mitochondrial import inner membrane translocase subunit TIM14 n=1 Tax=Castor canadensis TaxID=51338 RepID=A0A8C0XM93_CASCN
MTSTVVAVGLSIAAMGFAGRYVLQAMKHMEPQVKQVFQSLPKSAFSGGYYRASLPLPVKSRGPGLFHHCPLYFHFTTSLSVLKSSVIYSNIFFYEFSCVGFKLMKVVLT